MPAAQLAACGWHSMWVAQHFSLPHLSCAQKPATDTIDILIHAYMFWPLTCGYQCLLQPLLGVTAPPPFTSSSYCLLQLHLHVTTPQLIHMKLLLPATASATCSHRCYCQPGNAINHNY